MESIKRFLVEDSGSSEAVSSIVLIGAAALLLSAALLLYWAGFNTFFDKMATWVKGQGPAAG